MGAGSFLRKQTIKGFLYLGAQIAYIYYFITVGWAQILGVMSLGIREEGEYFNDKLGIYIYDQGDNSMLFLLFGVLGILMLVGFILLYRMSVKTSIENERTLKLGKKLKTFREEMKEYLNEKLR